MKLNRLLLVLCCLSLAIDTLAQNTIGYCRTKPPDDLDTIQKLNAELVSVLRVIGADQPVDFHEFWTWPDPKKKYAALIDRTFKKGFLPLADIRDAEILAFFLGIREMQDFKNLPSSTRLKLLNKVFSELAKTPLSFRHIIDLRGKKMDLVLGAVTSHPNKQHLKGVTPRGWPDGLTWDEVPGCGDNGIDNCTVIAADRLDSGHGSVNLILHEHAHTFVQAYSEISGGYLHDSTEFQEIHAASIWDTAYFESHRKEALVESIAKYYHSETTRNRLKTKQPDVHDYVESIFSRMP